MPTRIIEVGTPECPIVRIHETSPTESLRYVVLSHPWGAGRHFCTLPSNIDEYKQHINFDSLPATFRHAVITTRQLGIKYLWIDSLCIIQGPDGDFEQEAEKMESVFNSAYCVLAASSAKGQNDGFLNARKREREFVTFQRPGISHLYISHFVDDFNHDVLESNLSQRGWVLQERALARRTIYFTDTQIYWECGDGVRCETLAKMTK